MSVTGILRRALIVIPFTLLISGCYDRLDMEEASFSLVLGLDRDEQGNLIVYSSIPTFNQHAKKKTHEIVVSSISPREGRLKSDAYSVGSFQPRKLQVLVVSKALLLHKKEWDRYLDVFFRDGRNPVTSRVLVYDGKLNELFDYHPPDKPILPLQLLGMLESTDSRAETVVTTLQQLQRELLDKGQTPALPQFALDQELKLNRTALLDRDGRYAASLTSKEAMLLRLLQKNADKFRFTIPVPKHLVEEPGAANVLSFSADQTKTKIKVSRKGDKFRYDIYVHMPVNLTEILFPIDVVVEKAELEAACSAEIRKQLEALISKFQQKRLDPVGFGVYARAREYGYFKQVQDRWVDEFAKAEFNVKVNVVLADIGAIE
ncbi:Ger(x)C family spore germination protein [Paenibacillus methanolicus]|uniref:Ger(X)C family germination protein n=1 Tax=Paenibacillus methanolicus TaxID=582686 RepID=A0A5S5CHK1_9BACL|nr:Ger(x)C family spore germination protein [Paenibacillus methanolicus]TYP79240.1 Ger(x)C family germination protein [Paenibacillus methanolicus]